MSTTTNEVIEVKHINNKTAAVDPKECVRKNHQIFMIRMYGTVNGIKNFEDRKSGDLKSSFIGEFEAEGPDGKIYRSDKAFFFKALEEKISATFKAGGEKAVEFAYDIFAIPDDKSVTGYSYQARSLRATASSDAVSRLRLEIADKPIAKNDSDVPKPDATQTQKTAAPNLVKKK